MTKKRINKRCIKMDGLKNVKEPNEKKRFFYNISKDQSLKSGWVGGWKRVT